MRLIKLAAYSILGYVLYELFRGLTEEQPSSSSQPDQGRQSRGSRAGTLNRALNEDSGRAGAITGEGQGETVETKDSTGGSARHKVGRGVVSRA